MSVDLRPGSTALEAPMTVPMASTVASQWKAVGSALSQTQAVQNASIPPASWTGAAAEAASAEIQKFGTKVSGISQAFPSPVQAMEAWNERVQTTITAVQGFQAQWDEAIAKYRKDMADIDARVVADEEYRADVDRTKARAALRGAQAPLKKSYEDQIQQLDKAASDAAKAIRGSAESMVPPELLKAGRNAVGASLFGSDMPIASGAAQWEYAREVAPQMAADLQKLADSKRSLSLEQVKEFQEKWGDKLRNPYFVQALADEYRSNHGDFSDALNRMAINTAGDNGRYGADSGMSDSEKTTRNSLINSIGTAMVLATGGIDASEAKLSISATYEQVKHGLLGRDGATTIEQIEKANIENFKETAERTYVKGASGSKIRGFQVFTQASGFAAVKNPDLNFGFQSYEGGENSLAAKIVDCDRKYLSTRAGQVNTATYPSIVGLTGEEREACNLCRDPLQSLYRLSDTPDTLKEGTSPASLRNAEAIKLMYLRDFLNHKTGFHVDLPEGRNVPDVSYARYLTGNRNPGGVTGFNRTDGGEALGDMLADASNPAVTTPEPDKTNGTLHGLWERDVQNRVEIAANVMAGYQDGLDHGRASLGSDVRRIDGESVYGRENSALRSWMGSIIAPYIDGLASDMSDSQGRGMEADSSALQEDNKYKMRFTTDLLARFKGQGGLFEDLAFDKPETSNKHGRMPALQAVLTAAYKGYAHDLEHGLRATDGSLPGDEKLRSYSAREREAKFTIGKWTELIQELHDAEADKAIAQGKSADESNMMQRNVAKFVLGAVPLPASGIVEKLIEKAVRSAADAGVDGAWSVGNADKAKLQHEVSSIISHDLMQEILIKTMYDSGYWTEDSGAKVVSPESTGLRFLDEKGAVKSYADLTEKERQRVQDYFKRPESDFQPILADSSREKKTADMYGNS